MPRFTDFRLASFGLRSLATIEAYANFKTWRYGEIEVSSGSLVAIHRRWWPRIGSQSEAYLDSYHRTLPSDSCRAYFAFPFRAPGYMTVLYARGGPNLQYKTIDQAVLVMDEIAQLRDSNAIVCQVVSDRGTERLMNRWGYVRHACTLGDNHYIKRFR